MLERENYNNFQWKWITKATNKKFDLYYFLNPELTSAQMGEIYKGLEAGLDVSLYANPAVTVEEMSVRRLRLLCGKISDKLQVKGDELKVLRIKYQEKIEYLQKELSVYTNLKGKIDESIIDLKLKLNTRLDSDTKKDIKQKIIELTVWGFEVLERFKESRKEYENTINIFSTIQG